MQTPVGQTIAFRGLSSAARRASYVIAAAACLLLAACSNPLQPRIDAENRRLNEAKQKFTAIRGEVEGYLKQEPDLFRAANVTAAWRDRFQSDQEKLNDAFTDLEKLSHRDKNLSLFNDVDRLREAAVNDATSIQGESRRWLDLKRNTAAHIDKMKYDYDKIKSADVSKVEAALQKAENDWPAKKADLEGRLESLKTAPEKADRIWADVQQAKSKPDYAALMNAEQWLDSRAARPEKDLKLVAQLYESRDVLLEKLNGCRAELKVIRTHITDVDNHQSNTDSKIKQEDLPPSLCESLKNDIGMDIEHKPAGAFESEVQRTPQPPGFAYMAPPGQSNQYGHWETHNGTSVWTWLPQYLILRELLWGPHYVPVPSYEWDGYWTSYRRGTTYYGPGYSLPGAQTQTQTPSAPKYGTHGTFTTKRYADSRYQSSGGSYRDSQYRAGQQAGSSSSSSGHQFGHPNSSSQGQKFGGSSSGKRFGGSGASPRSAPSGRRFGKH